MHGTKYILFNQMFPNTSIATCNQYKIIDEMFCILFFFY
jgi:hypothetical protein